MIILWKKSFLCWKQPLSLEVTGACQGWCSNGDIPMGCLVRWHFQMTWYGAHDFTWRQSLWSCLGSFFVALLLLSICWSTKVFTPGNYSDEAGGYLKAADRGFWGNVFKGWSSSSGDCNCLMIFYKDFHVGCYGTAKTCLSAESFCSRFALSFPSAQWLVSWLLCITSVFWFILPLVFTALCQTQTSNLPSFFLIKSVDRAQMCFVSQHTLPFWHP